MRFDGMDDGLQSRAADAVDRFGWHFAAARPALIAACRATFMPAPACSTQPMHDVAKIVVG